MRPFKAAARTLAKLDAKEIAALLSAASDVALVLDEAGTVRDVAIAHEALAEDLGEAAGWTGRAWAGQVMEDSRPKVEELLREAAGGRTARWRHVNHRAAQGDAPVPVLYTALGLGSDGRVVAIGRDQRHVAALHQRLVDAQASMERDYARLRHAEARYRLLFEMSAEPALILDPADQEVLEANPAAQRLLGAKGGPGRPLTEAFVEADRPRLAAALAETRFAARPQEIRARLPGGRGEVLLAASPFRQERSALALVRLLPARAEPSALAPARAELLRLAETAGDAMAAVGRDGRLIAVNPAFVQLAQLREAGDALGEPLERWLGRPGTEYEVLAAHLRTRGHVRHFPTTLRGEQGALAEVEVCASPLGEGGASGHGFSIRDVGARLAARPAQGPALARPVEQLTELVGRVPLKDLVRETTEVIERLAIEAALELAGDNRAAAAEMLGLSRQSLYVKLRRYGLGADGAEDGEG